jgi:hypothetical protein
MYETYMVFMIVNGQFAFVKSYGSEDEALGNLDRLTESNRNTLCGVIPALANFREFPPDATGEIIPELPDD